jgi:hypothetical protein
MSNDVTVLYTVSVEGMEEVIGKERSVDEQHYGKSGGLQRVGKDSNSEKGRMTSHSDESTASSLEKMSSLFQ